MLTGRQYILIAAGIITVALSLAGGLMYPLVNQGILTIVIYEIVVILGISALLMLIYRKGMEDS
jgi:hypothetical protein